jgi:signal recognition particle-docking protein FtsY
VGFFDRLKAGLQKTKEALIGQVNTVMSVFRKIDDELFDELEEVLIRGDWASPPPPSSWRSCGERRASGG